MFISYGIKQTIPNSMHLSFEVRAFIWYQNNSYTATHNGKNFFDYNLAVPVLNINACQLSLSILSYHTSVQCFGVWQLKSLVLGNKDIKCL